MLPSLVLITEVSALKLNSRSIAITQLKAETRSQKFIRQSTTEVDLPHKRSDDRLEPITK